jgi:hypothetical protein
MNQHNRKEERDEVLFAFQQACERPTAEQIIAWTEQYPQFAEDIRLHAAVGRDWAASEELPAVEADETMLARAYSNALNALYQAEIEASSEAPQHAAKNFHEMLEAHGREVWQVASELDIARDVLADLFNGWMLGPVRKRLVDAVTSALRITRAAFDDALVFALQNPRMEHAKADGAPTITPRPCDEVIRDSNMSNERKRYWLEEV